MAEIAIFDDEAFTVTALTAALNDQPYLPGRISALGLFREEGITTPVSYTHLTLPTKRIV